MAQREGVGMTGPELEAALGRLGEACEASHPAIAGSLYSLAGAVCDGGYWQNRFFSAISDITAERLQSLAAGGETKQ